MSAKAGGRGGARLEAVAGYCDRLLRIAEVRDYEGAFNGLQVANRGRVRRVAAAVDGSLATARLAIKQGADLLLVHHGLFWGGSHPWTSKRYELMRLLLEHDLAVYSAHLPLDLHPRVGNNAELCKALGLRAAGEFFMDHGQAIGLRARGPVDRTELARRLEKATGRSTLVVPGGPKVCRRIGVVTGGAGSKVAQAAAEGVDTFVTGEGPHWSYTVAEELGINVLYGGHYGTETFGVKALAADLERRFGLPWAFVDYPTGM